MDNILTLIAFFVIIFIFGTLASWLLPFILPIIIFFWIISLFTGRKSAYQSKRLVSGSLVTIAYIQRKMAF